VRDIEVYLQVGQDGLFLCWAAVGVSMARYYHQRSLTQCEFVRNVRNLPNCPDQAFDMARALRGVPCLAEGPTPPLGPDALRTQISVDRPVCILMQISNLLTHVVVAVRCSSGQNPLVTILDPARRGHVDTVSYEGLRTGLGGRGPWLETFLTG
jgi:hypothetical protein